MKLILGLLAAVAFVGCNKKVEKKNEAYSYDFTVNGCATGKHTFSSVSALCAGLANDARNNGCAYGERYRMAKQYKCSHVSPAPMADALGGTVTQRYSYHFIVNGCDTGRHEFGSKAELCAGLADDVRNNGCAVQLRLQMFQEQGCR